MKQVLSVVVISLGIIILSSSCKKTDSPPDNISKMGRMRVWHGLTNGSLSEPGTSVHYSFSTILNDTFAVQIIDENTVSILGKVCLYDHTDPVSKARVFSCSFNGQYYPMFGHLSYYSIGDSMLLNCYGMSLHGEESYHLETH
jgi:hypothetical protein